MPQGDSLLDGRECESGRTLVLMFFQEDDPYGHSTERTRRADWKALVVGIAATLVVAAALAVG